MFKILACSVARLFTSSSLIRTTGACFLLKRGPQPSDRNAESGTFLRLQKRKASMRGSPVCFGAPFIRLAISFLTASTRLCCKKEPNSDTAMHGLESFCIPKVKISVLDIPVRSVLLFCTSPFLIPMAGTCFFVKKVANSENALKQ